MSKFPPFVSGLLEYLKTNLSLRAESPRTLAQNNRYVAGLEKNITMLDDEIRKYNNVRGLDEFGNPIK